MKTSETAVKMQRKDGGTELMDRTDPQYTYFVKILKEELKPAMGCTEPIAVAYCGAKVREVLGKVPERVEISVSGNIIKNVKSVIVPNTDGMKGIAAAAAVGIIAGDPGRELEVISEVSEEEKKQTADFLRSTPIHIVPIDQGDLLDIVISVYSGEESATVRIAHTHTNIVRIEKNGDILLDKPLLPEETGEKKAPEENLTVEAIYDFANTVKLSDVEETIGRQIAYNQAIAEEGIRNDWGANIGKVLLKGHEGDVRQRVKAMAAAGSDARMSGCELPVVVNSGSGNQGITVSVPLIVYAKEKQCSRDQLYRALVLSNLIAIHQKRGIGCLSAYCGAVSAGTAAGCGIAYLCGGDLKTITHTLVNAIAIASGMVCDGAKPSCAAKIAVALEAGMMGYEMYCQGQQFLGGDGIVSKGVENTIHNIGRLGADGMRETDKEIIRIMTQ